MMFQKAFQNSKILFSTEMANLFTGIAIVVLLARFLNVAALGLYSFSFAAGSVLAILCLAGSNQWITREIARNPQRLSHLLGHSFVTRGVIALGLLSLMEGAFFLMGYPRERIAVITLLVLVRVLECFILMLCACFRGFEEMRYERRIRMCLNAIHVGIGIPLLALTRSLFVFSFVQCALTFLVLVGATRLLIRRYAARPFEAITRQGCVQVFRQGFDFSLYTILLVVYLQTNTILLTLFKGHEATGFYTAGFRFVSALGMVAASSVDALFPAISRLNLREHEAGIKMAYLRSTKYLLVLASFFSLALFVFAPSLIRLFYGEPFLPAAPGLRIMAFSILFSYMNSSSVSLMFSLNQEKRSIRILGLCVVFVAAINLIFLPLWGYLGASLTTLLPELLNFSLHYKAITGYLKGIGLLTVLLKFVLLSLGVTGATLGWPGIPMALQGALFLVCYAGGLYLLRVFQPDEIAFIRDRYFRRSPALA